MELKHLAIAVLIVSIATNVSADEWDDLIAGLTTVAAALGVLMISIQGLKWITSDSPQDRAEAKKGLIYVILGLLVVYLAARLVAGLYCCTIKSSYGIEITCMDLGTGDIC